VFDKEMFEENFYQMVRQLLRYVAEGAREKDGTGL